jgi:subtilase family serine protease
MQRSQNILRRTALSAAAAFVFGGVALATAGSALAAAPTASMSVTATHATSLRSGDVIDGMVPFTQPIHIEVSLLLRNATELASFIDSANRPGAAARTMAPADFVARHAPTADQAQAVVDFLNQAGFRNVTVAPNRLLVSADGTADIVQTAFQTTLAKV